MTMQDLTGDKETVEVRIREDGRVLWVNLGERCVLRISGITALHIEDEIERASLRYVRIEESAALIPPPAEHLL